MTLSMLQHDFSGAFLLGFSLVEPWMNDFHSCHTPTVLYDNHIVGNPMISYVGIDNEEGMDLAIDYLKKLGHKKIGYLSSVTRLSYHAGAPQGIFSGNAQPRPQSRLVICRMFLLSVRVYGKAPSTLS